MLKLFLFLSIINQIFGDESTCKPATSPISRRTHFYAPDDLNVGTIAFTSCYVPESMKGNTFWNDVRNEGKPDLWLWLGDNMYKDGTNLDAKREKYNSARDETSYISHGPLALPKIPVMATWDDHDYASNNLGNDYPCKLESQDEFVTHFNIPESDPRHKNYSGGERQKGVYSSNLFYKDDQNDPMESVHVILLDARSGRDPTYFTYGECKGANSRMLIDEQWDWLDKELEKTSTIKVIGSGVQVLPPTYQSRVQSIYCADDSHSQHGSPTTTFTDSILAVGEDSYWEGTSYESWAEIPQERKKLLQKAQLAINRGRAKMIIFVSGDQHWAELMAKEMPSSLDYGPAQTLYEVTASVGEECLPMKYEPITGLYQNYPFPFIPNSNRLRDRSANHQGSGPYNQGCVFPFVYKGERYTSCTEADSHGLEWCSTLTDVLDNHLTGYWGNCDSLENELAQNVFSNSTNTCSKSRFHICSAESNYGQISVDFDNRKVKMSIRTPDEQEEAYHEVSY